MGLESLSTNNEFTEFQLKWKSLFKSNQTSVQEILKSINETSSNVLFNVPPVLDGLEVASTRRAQLAKDNLDALLRQVRSAGRDLEDEKSILEALNKKFGEINSNNSLKQDISTYEEEPLSLQGLKSPSGSIRPEGNISQKLNTNIPVDYKKFFDRIFPAKEKEQRTSQNENLLAKLHSIVESVPIDRPFNIKSSFPQETVKSIKGYIGSLPETGIPVYEVNGKRFIYHRDNKETAPITKGYSSIELMKDEKYFYIIGKGGDGMYGMLADMAGREGGAFDVELIGYIKKENINGLYMFKEAEKLDDLDSDNPMTGLF